ncbi:MAG TPA: MarR family transcriptional regulator [Candidatus Saccharimonadales bacterium]|nr:MarR family transcriptional regulator [Candidatus Saccharimonadales bacterium]
MKRATISTKFYLSLVEFLMSAKQHLVAIGAESGLSSIQAVTLLLLDEHTPRPMKNLGQLFHCDASNITGIIDGLEQKGLVARQNDPSDRRIKTICICPAGKKLQQHILNQLAQGSGFLFDPLTPTEAEQFVRIVEKLTPPRKSAL